jgi:intein-encoded DNA endonuclease-like protein
LGWRYSTQQRGIFNRKEGTRPSFCWGVYGKRYHLEETNERYYNVYMKKQGKVLIKWSSEFAYVIGLIATDGNLSPDGRHIAFTSKDKELADNVVRGLGVSVYIGTKASGSQGEKKYYVVQFSDVAFYRFLETIGLTPAKSKTIKEVQIPQEYMADFLRGHFDGDGTFYSYWDKRWKHSFMFYMTFLSASKVHIDWLRECLMVRPGIRGHVTKAKLDSTYRLRYAKKESLKLISYLYYDTRVLCLSRKRIKIAKALKVR